VSKTFSDRAKVPKTFRGTVRAFSIETMGRRLRYFEPEHCYFVTARCFQARLLLRPSPSTNALVGGILARAARLHAVELFAFVFASNHVHLLVRAPKGNLPGFMQFLLGNIARKVAPMVPWQGRLWERRYSAAPVLDSDALDDRLRYILAHGVKEGLVKRCSEWPGLSSLGQLLGNAVRPASWFNWSRRARMKASQRAERLDSRLAEPEQLEVRPLPGWEDMSEQERVNRVRAVVADIERQAAKEHPTPLGVAEVLAQHPYKRTIRPRRGPAPLCHTSDPKLRTSFREAYADFVRAVRSGAAQARGRLVALIPRYDVRLFLWPSAVAAA
jgi:REP element-mobilizing transposase RayT